jgi:oxygen-independent coproporphyrinogen-3 oxidase
MAGIYIHIPFCRSKCDYCNFFSVASKRGINEMASAICSEARLRKNYLGSQKITSIYFGGGTPSLLPPGDIKSILDFLHKTCDIENFAEITLEANPDDINTESLISWKAMGINRLSIGIQSFSTSELKYLSRKHDPFHAISAIENSLSTGFSNLSIDLIFGIPNQGISGLEANLRIFRKYPIPHLSAYALTVEPNTALAWKITNKKILPVKDKDQTLQFLFLMDWMESEGFTQYEISNYCLPGFESRHNSSYWSGESYLGLGPSAHSFDGVSRQWNLSNVSRYLEAMKAGKPLFEREILTTVQQHNEYVMTALRTSAGISLDYFEHKFGASRLRQLKENCRGFIAKEWLIEENAHLKLSKHGKLFADLIAAELFDLP